MAMPWHRHREPPPRLQEPSGQPSVADVVHRLQYLSGELREQVTRLERANERIEQSSKGTP